MRRVLRLNSRTPRSASSAASVRTTVGKDAPNTCEAAVRLPCSAIHTNAAMLFSLSIKNYSKFRK